MPTRPIALKTTEIPAPARLWPVWGVLVACVWLAFSPSLDNGFVDWDDKGWIVENHAFQGLGWDQVRFAFTTTQGGVYQPIGWLVQSLTFEIYGLEARGYHRVGLLFHALNVVLLHLLCVKVVTRTMPEVAGRLGGWLGWLCGVPVLLFAVHPLRVEPVAWASCQAYLPGVAFSLLATLAYLRAHPPGGPLRRSWMVGSSVLVVLAVLSKGSAVVLPVVFLILDAYPLGRLGPGRPFWTSVRRPLIEKAPILAFCLAFTIVAIEAKRTKVEPEVTTGSVVVARVAQASFGAWFYLEKTVWPFGITAFYPRPERGDFWTPLFGASVVGILLATSLAIGSRRRWPWLPATLAAYVVIASPYLGLFRVGLPVASDRYSYAPMMAWVVLGCAGLCGLGRRRWPRPVLFLAGAGTVAVIGGLMSLSSAQCRVWDSSEHLWAQALEQAGWSADLHKLMGSALAERGKSDRAIEEFREVLRLRPHDFEATCDLGVLLDRRGETDEAIGFLREARKLEPKDARVLLSLGAALARQGQLDEAIAIDREALQIRPDVPDIHFNLGVALLRQRKVDEAIDELSTALKLRPQDAEANASLAAALVLKGRLDEAIDHYRQALRLDPGHSASRINLGLTLARQRHRAEAIVQLREAIRRDPRNPEAHHVLGVILVNAGLIQEAAIEFEETLKLRPDHAQARAFLAMARRGRE